MPLAVVIDESTGTVDATTLTPAVRVSLPSVAVMIGVPTPRVAIGKSTAELPLPIVTDAGTETALVDALSETTVALDAAFVSVTRPVAVTPSGTLAGVTVNAESVIEPGWLLEECPLPHAAESPARTPIAARRSGLNSLTLVIDVPRWPPGASPAGSRTASDKKDRPAELP